MGGLAVTPDAHELDNRDASVKTYRPTLAKFRFLPNMMGLVCIGWEWNALDCEFSMKFDWWLVQMGLSFELFVP